MVDVHQLGNRLPMQMVAEPLLGWTAHALSTLTMAVERLMAVEIEPLLGLQGQRRPLTVSSRTVLLRDPRLQDMEAVVIPGDQRHLRISILLPPMTIGVRIKQRPADGAEILMMHQLLERICQRLHLRL
jgi:hypothetical protein